MNSIGKMVQPVTRSRYLSLSFLPCCCLIVYGESKLYSTNLVLHYILGGNKILGDLSRLCMVPTITSMTSSMLVHLLPMLLLAFVFLASLAIDQRDISSSSVFVVVEDTVLLLLYCIASVLIILCLVYNQFNNATIVQSQVRPTRCTTISEVSISLGFALTVLAYKTTNRSAVSLEDVK